MPANRRLLIPGILGSQLNDDKKRKVWFNLARIAQEPWQLIDDDASEHQLKAVDYLRLDAPYDALIDRLDAEAFPYDWRKALAVSGASLVEHLMARGARGEHIDVVTHSMGGLVLATAIAQQPRVLDHLHRVVFCAPPFYGSVAPAEFLNSDSAASAWLHIGLGLNVTTITASWNGLFDMFLAPKRLWPTESFGRATTFGYPSTASADPYKKPHGAFRQEQMDRVERAHEVILEGLELLIDAKRDDVHVIVAMNGETRFRLDDGFAIERHRPTLSAPFADGDGTVLTASSVIPHMREDHFYGVVFRAGEKEPHPNIMKDLHVQRAIVDVLEGAPQIRGVFIGDAVFDRLVGYASPAVAPPANLMLPNPALANLIDRRARSSIDLGPSAFDYTVTQTKTGKPFKKGDKLNVAVNKIVVGSFPRDFGNERMGEIAMAVTITTDNPAGGGPVHTEWTLVNPAAEGYKFEFADDVITDVVNNVVVNEFVRIHLELREVDNYERLKGLLNAVNKPLAMAVKPIPTIGSGIAVGISIANDALQLLVPDENAETFFQHAQRYEIAKAPTTKTKGALRRGLYTVVATHKRNPSDVGGGGVHSSTFELELW